MTQTEAEQIADAKEIVDTAIDLGEFDPCDRVVAAECSECKNIQAYSQSQETNPGILNDSDDCHGGDCPAEPGSYTISKIIYVREADECKDRRHLH